tara:strand:+ start:267 stop:428 length:162 start_codon:yes stop_codon:yes gene_type:complete
MIDNIMLKLCDWLDQYNDWINNLFAPRCKCGKNKSKRTSNKEWIKGYKQWKNK